MIIFADGRGKLEAEFYATDDAATVMLSVTAQPYPVHLALDAAEARLLAAKLMDFADEQDEEEDRDELR